MGFTDVGSGGGRIYDSGEIGRLNSYANQFNSATDQMDKEEAKKKDTKRYVIIGFSAVLLLVILKLIAPSKK